MPVTAKLSKLFYDRLGEEIADELVNWFNAVDATYRSDLRELNELNFARFDAKLEQRLAEFDSKLERRLAESDAKLEQRLAEFEAKLGGRMTELEIRLERRVSGLEATLERRLAEQTRWLFVAWASLLLPIIGLWIRG
jgi:DNA anti-recombination protein RmuC